MSASPLRLATGPDDGRNRGRWINRIGLFSAATLMLDVLKVPAWLPTHQPMATKYF
jgi:hypothetical protein